jgi:hypothetical protein
VPLVVLPASVLLIVVTVLGAMACSSVLRCVFGAVLGVVVERARRELAGKEDR